MTAIEQALIALLDEGRGPALVFQPIVDLKRGETVGYEVLSRFRGPPVAGPDLWFAAARAVNRANELELRVLEHALSKRAQLPSNCFLSVNVAPEALLDPRMAALLRSQEVSRVVFELTEHTVVADYELLARAIREVRSNGGLVAVDDAGAGYASLSHILELRPDIVKLDRSLIEGVHSDDAKAALIEMFGAFTNRIDAWILAEGIEEPAELARLVQLGVPLAQGYLLGRPGPEMAPLSAELTKLLRDARASNEHAPLTALLDSVGSFAADSGDDALLEALAASALPIGVLLDETRHAKGVVTLLTERRLVRRAAMCVLDSAKPLQVLQRALTRGAETRFDPLVCCDEAGHYRGVVRIERLIEALLFPPTRKLSWAPASE